MGEASSQNHFLYLSIEMEMIMFITVIVALEDARRRSLDLPNSNDITKLIVDEFHSATIRSAFFAFAKSSWRK